MPGFPPGGITPSADGAASGPALLAIATDAYASCHAPISQRTASARASVQGQEGRAVFNPGPVRVRLGITPINPFIVAARRPLGGALLPDGHPFGHNWASAGLRHLPLTQALPGYQRHLYPAPSQPAGEEAIFERRLQPAAGAYALIGRPVPAPAAPAYGPLPGNMAIYSGCPAASSEGNRFTLASLAGALAPVQVFGAASVSLVSRPPVTATSHGTALRRSGEGGSAHRVA
ncbi:MAG: hypothetical protein IT318_07025 [Anaerolineales bacterium]|nr:hypothetical protein [Anaerolineales bacterium]